MDWCLRHVELDAKRRDWRVVCRLLRFRGGDRSVWPHFRRIGPVRDLRVDSAASRPRLPTSATRLYWDYQGALSESGTTVSGSAVLLVGLDGDRGVVSGEVGVKRI